MRKAFRFVVNLFCIYALVFFPAIAAAQTITIDRTAPSGQRPQIKTTGGGKPQINIAPPSNGVSVNRYSSFSTNSGAIFNNSTAAGTSQTGGSVARNTRLSTGAEAKVILNDVRGTSRSNLRGNFEIFGKRADLVIANQNGITCNGCTFINASRTTLSSGAPSVNANGDVILNVKKGNVHIGRSGATADGHLNLVGRTVTVDGPVKATVVDAIGGASTYNTRNRAVGANTGSGSAGSAYAVDATQFGAMTAGQIRIIGNENGLGVRTRGTLTSTSTDVSLHSKGNINHAAVKAKRDFVVRGANGRVQQDQGTVTAGRNIDIRAKTYAQPGSARMSAAGNVKIVAGDAILIAGEINSATATYDAVNRVVNVGEIIASGDVKVVAGEVWNMRSDRRIDRFFAKGGVADGCKSNCLDVGSLQIAGSANWSDRSYMIGHGGVVAAKNLTITARNTDINNSGVLVAAQSLLLDAKRTVTQKSLKAVYRKSNSGSYLKTDLNKAKSSTVAARIAAMTGGSVRDIYNGVRNPLISGSRVYYGTKAQGIGSLTVKAGHHVQNLGGEFKSSGRVLLETANYDINLRSHGRWSHNFSHSGNFEAIAKRNINLNNAHFRADAGTLKLHAGDGIGYNQASIDAATYRNLYIREMGDGFNNPFSINTPGWVNIASRGTFTGNRAITAGSIYLQSTHGELNQNSATRSTNGTTFKSSSTMRVSNTESRNGILKLQSTAGSIYIRGNARATNSSIDIDAEHSVINGTSTMFAQSGINIWAGSSITNEGGRIWSNGNIDLLAGRKRGGNIISSHGTASRGAGHIRAYGTAKNVRLDTDRGTIRLTNNAAIASGNVTLDASGELWIQRSHVEGNTVTLGARTNYIVNETDSRIKANLYDVVFQGGKSLYNRSGATIWAKRDVNATINAMYNHGQPVTAGRDIRLTMGNRLENYHSGSRRAVLNAGRHIVITSAKGDVYNRRSDMTAGGNITINAGVDRVQMWDTAKLTTGGALSITSGESGSDRDGLYLNGVALSATTMDINTTGRIVLHPGSHLTTTSGDMRLTAGRHFHQLNSDLTSAAAMYVNTNGVSMTGSRSQSVGYMKYDSGNWVQLYDGYGRNPVLKSTTGSVDVISRNSHIDTRRATLDAKRYVYMSARNNLALQTNTTVRARTLDATLKAGVGGHIYYRYGSNVSAGRDVRLDSRNNVYIHGRTLTAGRDIISNARAQFELYNDGASRAKLQAGRNITVNTIQGRILTRASDWVANTGNIAINAGTHSVEFWDRSSVTTAGSFTAKSGNWDGRGVRLIGMPVTATSIYLGSGTGHILLDPGSDLTSTKGNITIAGLGRYYQRNSDVISKGGVSVTSNGVDFKGSGMSAQAGAITMASTGSVNINDDYGRNPWLWASGAITVSSANSHVVNHGNIGGGGDVSITSRTNLHNDHSALIRARGGDVVVRSTHGNVYNRYKSRILSKRYATIEGGTIHNDGATVSAGGRISMTARHHLRVIDSGGVRSVLQSGTDAGLSTAGLGGLSRKSLQLRSGTSSIWTRRSDLTAGTTLFMNSASANIHNEYTAIHAGNSASLGSKNEFRATGGSLSATGVAINSSHHLYLLSGHRLTARNNSQSVELKAYYDYLLRDSFVTAGRDVVLSDARNVYIYDSDTTARTGKVDYTARGELLHRYDNTDESRTTAATDIRMVSVGRLQNYRANMTAGRNVHLESTGSWIDNNAGGAHAGNDLTMIAKRNLHLQDSTSARDTVLTAGNNMTIRAGDTLYADRGFINAGHWLRFQSRLTPRFYEQVYANADYKHFGVNVSQGSFTSNFNVDTTGAIDIYARDGVTLNQVVRGDNWVRVKAGGTGKIFAGYLLRSDGNTLDIRAGGDITLGNAQAAKSATIESTAGSVINTYNISAGHGLTVKAHKDIIARHSVATRLGAFRGTGSVNMNAGRHMTITNALVSSNGQIDMYAAQKELGTLSVKTTQADKHAGVQNRTTAGKSINMMVYYGGHIDLVGAKIWGEGLVNTYAGAFGGGQYTTSAANINGTPVKTLLRGTYVRQNANTLTLADTDLIGLGDVSQFAQQSGSITMDRGRIQTHNLRVEALGNTAATATYRNLTDITVGDRLVLDVAKSASLNAGTIAARTYDFVTTPNVTLNGNVRQQGTNNLTITATNNLTMMGTTHRRNINLTSLNGVLANTGTLRANYDVRLTANRRTAGMNLRNDGLLWATRDVFVNADRGIDPGRIQARNIEVTSARGIISGTGAMMADQQISLAAADITTRSVLAQSAVIDARSGSFTVQGWQVGDGNAFQTGLNEFTTRMGDIVGTISDVVDGETEEVTEAEFEDDLRTSGNAMFHVESDLNIETRDNINLRAGGILSSRGDMTLTAGKGVNIESSFGESVYDVVVKVIDFGSRSIEITEQRKKFSHRRAAVIADGNLTITARGNGLNLTDAGLAAIVTARDAERASETGVEYLAGSGVIWNNGTISAGGDLILNAAKDIVNKSTRVTYTLTKEHNCGHKACGRDAYMFAPGEMITGQGLIMTAGMDIFNEASQVAAASSIYATAGNDIYNDIQTAHFLSYYYKKTKRFLGIKTGETIDKRYSAAMQSGVFQTSFGDIDLIAGRDIDSSGSYVSAGANARLKAGNDIYMDAISVELHNQYKNSGFSGFLTYSSTKTRYNNFETSMAQVEGFNVSIDAGNDLTGIGVVLLAMNDLRLVAGGDMVYDAKTNRKYLEESGWSFGLTSSRFTITQSVLDNANNDPIHQYIEDNPMLGAAYQLATAEDGWGRLNGALALLVSGARTLSTARDQEVGTNLFGSKLAESFIPNDIKAIKDIAACREKMTRCVMEAAGIGFRFDAWHSRQEWDESLVTRIGSGRDMYLDAGNDIQLAGGTIVNAGRNLMITADNDFIATALANTQTSESSSFGFGVSLYSGGFTVSVDGSGSNGHSKLYTNASINALNSITLITGRDAMLLGAVMQSRPVEGVEEDADGNPILDADGNYIEVLSEAGGDIFLDIGRDLVVASKQSTSASNSWGFGLSLSFTGGSLSGVGINANIAEGNARYVDTPSMIDAHRILDIYVDEKTYLMGAVIASRNDGLYLDTGYLVHDNLFNENNSYSVNVGINIGVGETLSFDGTAGFTLDVTEGFTRATISGGDVVVRNQADFDISQINQDLTAVDTITRETHVNLQLPALNLVKLAKDLEAAGNYIRAAAADVPDEVRARGDVATTVYRRMIASGMSIQEAMARTQLPEFQASVNAIRRVIELEQRYPEGGVPEDELFLMAIAEQALYDADGNIVLSVECDLLGRCEIAAENLDELIETWRHYVLTGETIYLPVSVRQQLSDNFTAFLIACSQENPALIVQFVQNYGAEAVAHLAEFRASSQANVPWAQGFDSALLLTAIAAYVETGDQVQLINQMVVAQDTFLEEHGHTLAERQAAMSAFFGFAVGFLPVVGDAMDAADLLEALENRDIAGVFISGVGFVPLGGDAFQALSNLASAALTGTRRVGVDEILTATRRDQLPDNYTRTSDDVVTGPRGGRYNAVGDPVLGEQVFRDSGGRYWIFRDGVKVRASNPAERPNLANNLQPNPLQSHRAHHQAYVDDLSSQLEDMGYEVANDVRFHSSCSVDYCMPDIVYRDPNTGQIVGIIEVKTGNATLSTNQTLIYPQIRNGSSIPSGNVARSLGLEPGIPLRNQGYPNGINVYEQTFQGLGN